MKKPNNNNMLGIRIISMLIFANNLRPVHCFRIIIQSFHPSPRFLTNNLHSTTTTPLQSDDVSAAEKIDWQMHRDECDDWLDEALIQRSNNEAVNDDDTPSSIFNVAACVVDYFVSGASCLSTTPPLHRVWYGDMNSDGDPSEEQQLVGNMFAPLFDTNIKDADTSTSSTSLDTNPSSSVKWAFKKKRRRTNLKLTLAYRGRDFCGWEDQRHSLYRNAKNGGRNTSRIDSGDAAEGHSLPSVQGTLVDILDPVLGNRANDVIPHQKSKRMKTKNKPIEIKVAGRTDRGVGAIGQVCRIRTWKEIDEEKGVETYVRDLVNGHTTTNHDVGLRVTDAERVGGDFHPSFGATSRSYVYLIDLEKNGDYDECNSSSSRRLSPELVPKLNRMLRALEGKELDYFALSHGKVKTQTTLCTLYHARAGIVEWIGGSDNNDNAVSPLPERRRAICFELVGNRFLRRMVRILVATALREAYRDDRDCYEDALLRILTTGDRRLRSRAAPPDGLIFIGASF